MSEKTVIKTRLVSVVDHEGTGRRARAWRMWNNASLRQVAKQMGISAAFLSDLERGHRNWDEPRVELFNWAVDRVCFPAEREPKRNLV